MANAILDKSSSVNNFTISLASLPSSTLGVGQQSTLITNTAGYTRIGIHLRIRQGSSTPTGNRFVYVYAIRGDGTTRDDGAGATDASWTRYNAFELGTLANKSSPAANEYVYGSLVLINPGSEWGIGIVHDTGVNLGSTEGDHLKTWIGYYDEVQ